jgi:tetratricopeptide (TPR) repeat protein
LSTSSVFEVDANRDATASIRGYVYQIYQSVLAWMLLKENELLVLEGAEDFDVYNSFSVVTTQVKDVASNITLRTADVIDTLNNHWANKEKNPDYDIILRFLTTSEAGQEQGSPFGPGVKGLNYWQSAESNLIDVEPLRTFLLTLGLSQNIHGFIKDATGDELREQLISRIKWDMGNKQREAIQYTIEAKLKIHGFKLSINTHLSCQALPYLLKKTADLLSTNGPKELRFCDFLTSFDEATTVTIPRGKLEAMASTSNLQQFAGMFDSAEMLRLANISTTIGNPIPIVDGGISRTTVVSNLTNLLLGQRVIFLCGSSGLGKTNLASLICHQAGESWGWAGFRGMQPDQIKDVLNRVAFEMNSDRLPPFLVLDDLDLSQVSIFEREFITLVFSVFNSNGMVIITGPIRPPLQLLPKLWKDEACEVSVPYFNETEVTEMVYAHGLFDSKRTTEWARTIWITTSGHPQLVHARVRNISARGWPSIELSDLTKPEDVERVRSEARLRLVKEFPTENTRLLAYRLSLINGVFTRETAIAIAETPPPTTLPGEAFDALIGPWIEREGANRYRVSPLLTGAANNVLSDANIKAVHGAIALSIISRKSINQLEVGTAFFHAFMAKHAHALFMLASKISMADSKHMHLLYDAMTWLTFVGLDAGQKILPENPSIDLILRVAQYKLIAASPEPDKSCVIIDRIEEILNEIEPTELRQYSEILAYGMILNTLEVKIPSSKVIRMISRMIDLQEESPVLKEISNSFANGHSDLPRLGENKPAQLLFSYQAIRLSGLDDLSELVASLDALPPNKRDQLLIVCDSDFDFASLLISRAWWKEVEGGTLDVNKALRLFDLTMLKSREWKRPEITKACFVAMSVIQDEYGNSIERALEVLDAADNEFPDDANVINQRAKVLFHANRDNEALPIAYKALELPGLSTVEFVFCCRVTGIAAAKSDDWAETERLFLLGAEKTKLSSVQQSMGIGLMADVAFALWKQKKFDNSLLLFAQALDSLGEIPLSDDIRTRHLHATVRHCISWIHFEARGKYPSDFIEPVPGMCSNQEPHEGIKDHRIIDISAAWDLLASTEQILGLDLGIKARAYLVAGGKKPLLIEGYNRALAFELIFKNKNFDDLVTAIIGMHEAILHSKSLKDGQDDEWTIGDVPKLPEGYWDKSEALDFIYHYLLVASVICTFDNQASPLPIVRWRADLAKASTLTDEVNCFLNVLSGAIPDQTLYQQAAAAIFALRNGVFAPSELWKGSFRLINALMNEKRLVETSLEGLLNSSWLFAINSQRFAFSTPSLACADIEKCCFDDTLNGLAKISTVLEAAAPYLNVRLSLDAKQMLRRIIEQT